MSTKKMLVMALCVLSGVLLYAAPPSKTVEAEGFGETIQTAIKNARENAVRKTFGEVIDSVTETKNEELVESTIAASSGFVLSSKIIGTPKYDAANKFYVVKISAVVATEKMKDHISRFKKSSTAIDLSSNFKASDNAEVQEKNAFALLNWLIGELSRSIIVEKTDVKLGKNNDISINYSIGNNINIVKELQNKTRKILLANGYKRIRPSWRISNGSPVRNSTCIGSYFIIPPADYGHLYNVKNDDLEIYQNPNVLLFYGPYSDYKHPQNFYHAPHTKSQFEINIITAKGIRRTLAKEKVNLLLSLSNDQGKAEERCSFAPIIARCNSGKNFFRPGYSLSFNAPAANFSDAKAVEFSIVSTYPGNKIKRTVLKNYTLNTESLFSQHNARGNLTKSLVALLVKYNRDYYKQIQPKANFEYKRLQNAGVLTLELSIDRRGHITQSRNIRQKLEDLGIETIKLEPGIGFNANRRDNLSFGVVGLWHANFTIDFANLSSSLEKELAKYNYVLTVKFKNRQGEVLQTEKIRIPREFTPSVSKVNSYTVDYICYPNNPRGTYTMNNIAFDIPEDIKNVKSIECYIEERISQ